MLGKEKEIDSLTKNKEFIHYKHTCIIEGKTDFTEVEYIEIEFLG